MLLYNHNTLYSYRTTLSFRTSINYTSGYSSIVTSNHFEFKCNPLHYTAEVTLAMTSIANQIIDPPIVEAAKKLEDWPKWQASIENEFDIHKKLRTRELVTPPPNANIVGSI